MTEPTADTGHAENAFRRLACRYARAMDRNEPALLDAIVTPEIVIEGPGFRLEGLEEVRGSPAMLRNLYVMTQHVVHHQTLTVDADRAEGETYCTASHILRPSKEGEGHTALIWAIRYADRLRREGGTWRISARKLTVDWSETRPVQLGAGG